MISAFTLEFAELPLIYDGMFEAGLIFGQAEISFDEEGDWFVSTISLDGYRHPRKVHHAEVLKSEPGSLVRHEFEYEIPFAGAVEMIAL